jgi:hypothetical protein
MMTTAHAYRLGEAVLEVDSDYPPLLEDLEHSYGDCARESLPSDELLCGDGRPRPSDEILCGDGRPRPSDDGRGGRRYTVRCTARAHGSHVTLRFDTPTPLPNLAQTAHALLRPRVELQHFVLRDGAIIDERTNTPLLTADHTTAVVDTRDEPAELLLNFVIGVAQIAQPSMIFLHAGGVSVDGRGTLLIGRSGQGKSTTTATLASRGHALLGDETVGLRPDTRELHAFHRTIKLRPGPRGQVVDDRLDVVPHSIGPDAAGTMCTWVRPTDLFPNTARTAPLRDVFFLRSFSDRAGVERFTPTLDHLEELQALTMSLSSVISWPASAAHRLMRFVRILEVFNQCRCWFVDLGTPDETAALIERTVQS